MNLRKLSIEVLMAVVQDRVFLSHALAKTIAAAQPSPPDQRLVQAMCYGVLRHYYRLTALAKPYLQKPLKAKDQDVHLLILLGLYQLTEMRIPAHAAVAETVNASRELGKSWAGALINAILRSYLRHPKPLPDLSAAQYEHPDWLLGKLKKCYPDAWQSIVCHNLAAPPMHLRVNRRKVSREAYLELLLSAGIQGQCSDLSADGITLSQAVDVSKLPHFADGWVSVQDLAAQMAMPLLDIRPGQRILDACAAPGGKTAHILESQADLCLIATDVDSKRLSRIADNLQRLQLQAELKAVDAADLSTWWDGQAFDRILLDAPCSATGVIRRHPDIRLLRSAEEVKAATLQQQALLQALWPSLKPGGILLYATCSVLPEENDRQVQTFLNARKDAKVLDIKLSVGDKTPYGWQFLPSPDGPDGFYYAKLQKQ